MPRLDRVCVYCGSRPGADPAFAEAARRLGARLAREGLGLVTGGGSVGLMGVVADAALAGGGTAVGVIPGALAEREIGHAALTELRVVDTMHERKATMAGLADAFVALPGGIGTLEEIAEVLTWTGLGLHAKPCALLNVGGYYDPFVAWLDDAAAQGFLRPRQRSGLWVEAEPDALVDRLLAWAAGPGAAPC